MDRKSLVRDQVRLEMMSQREESESWVNAFKTAGIFKELHGELGKVTHLTPHHEHRERSRRDILKTFKRKKSLQEKSTTESILEDKDLKEQTKILKYLVEAYMRITDKTIKDIVPKYIVLLLVKATQEFIKKELVGVVLKDRQTEEARSEILQVNQDFQNNINELLQIREATKKALDIFMKL